MSNTIKKLPPIKKPKFTRDQFIIEARKIHGDRYSYERLDQPILSRYISVICSKHGEFKPKGQHHLNGSNCKLCVNENRAGVLSLAFQRAQENFIEPLMIPDAKLTIGSMVEFTCVDHGLQKVSRYWFDHNQQCPTCKEDKVNSKLGDWQTYHKKVWKITRLSWKTKQGFIDHYSVGRSKFGYHLDHQYSVKQGFIDKIDPDIIGHWSNLWLLPYNENTSKGSRCSVTKELLFSNYSNLKRKFGS